MPLVAETLTASNPNLFGQRLLHENYRLRKSAFEVLQVNLGRLCNLTCVHCHVEAGPTKTAENMSRKTAEAVAGCMDRLPFKTLDLTGGAPEMNPNFRYLVCEARQRNMHVIDRCNLTILFEKGQEDLAQFLKEQQVEVVASLPCYEEKNVDKQRGDGTFMGSIKALRTLNGLGYGMQGSRLILNLVYNPVGAHLPPEQESLEKAYKQRLERDFGVYFNGLYTITNMPITRYEKYLKAFGQYEDYVKLLEHSFNRATLDGLMCRTTLSVAWDGSLYDCDFNQMLGMKMRSKGVDNIFSLNENSFEDWEILTGNHCFGCTAGAGSSCQGAID